MKSNTLPLDSMLPLSWESFHLKGVVIESLLVAAAAAFWLVILPLVAVSLVAVKIWDTPCFRPSPLFLRPLRASRGIIHVKVSGHILDLRSLRITSRCWSWP